MNWPESLLHVVGREEVRDTGKLVQQVVFESEHGRRTDNRSLGVDRANQFLSPSLHFLLASHPLLPILLTDEPTLVAKYSEGEFLSALYDETCTKRSMSYFAVASTIRSTPSTLTSV